MTAAVTAHPARQRFGRRVVVHAVADKRITLPTLPTAPGEPLCATLAPLEPCEPGLFAEPVTCRSCLAVIEREHVEVTS